MRQKMLQRLHCPDADCGHAWLPTQCAQCEADMGGEFSRCPACNAEGDPYACSMCGSEGQHEEAQKLYPEWDEKDDGPVPALMLQGLDMVIEAHRAMAQDEHGVAGMLEREAAFRRYEIDDPDARDMLHTAWDEIQQAVVHEKNRKLEKDAEARKG